MTIDRSQIERPTINDGTIKQPPGLLQRILGGHIQWFQQRLAYELHSHGVPLLLGTDTFGFPGLPPGSSLHKEMDLLHNSGLTPYEILQTATVNPAAFLGQPNEFGRVTVGERADLLLLSGNPLQDLNLCRHPEGVMVRGGWFQTQELYGKAKLIADLN